MKREFTLTHRTTSKGKRIYYMYYYEGDKRMCLSTGAANKFDAEKYARSYLADMKGDADKNVTFRAYAEGFFDWETSPWIKRQQAKNRSVTRTTAAMRAAHIRNYLMPFFGNKLLSKINAVQIENWIITIERTNQTRKHILGTLRLILSEAEREGIIPFNPVRKVEPFGRDTKKRDVFTRAELETLFPKTLDGLLAVWGDVKNASIFMMLAMTGVRSGELRALQWKHVHREGFVEICQAVKIDKTIGGTKTNTVRTVLLLPRVIAVLEEWYAVTPHKAPEDFVFPGIDGNHPLDRFFLLRAFRRAMKAAKIEIEGRNLVVHSFRHTFNTLLKPVLPLTVLQSITGHTTEEMTEHYNHPTALDTFNSLKAVLPQIEEVLDSRKENQ